MMHCVDVKSQILFYKEEIIAMHPVMEKAITSKIGDARESVLHAFIFDDGALKCRRPGGCPREDTNSRRWRGKYAKDYSKI